MKRFYIFYKRYLRDTFSKSPEKYKAFKNELSFYGTNLDNIETLQNPNIKRISTNIVKIDKSFSIYKFKSKKGEKVYQIEKVLLEKYPDSLLYRMVTTEVPMEIKDNVILLDCSPEKVSMVFDCVLHKKLPLQFDLNEWEAAFDFFCFDAPKFEEHCLYINNDVRLSYHINPKVPTTFECSKFYDVLLKEDYWKRLLSNFGVILSARFTANHSELSYIKFLLVHNEYEWVCTIPSNHFPKIISSIDFPFSENLVYKSHNRFQVDYSLQSNRTIHSLLTQKLGWKKINQGDEILIFEKSSVWKPQYYSMKNGSTEIFECLEGIQLDKMEVILTRNRIAFIKFGHHIIIQYPVKGKFKISDYFTSEDIIMKVMEMFPVIAENSSVFYCVAKDYQKLQWVEYIEKNYPKIKIKYV